MNVVFISPHYPPEMQDFTRGLAEVGARVIGVGELPLAAVPGKVRHHLADYIRVPALLDELGAAETIAASVQGKVDRIESLWEPTVLLAARLRERLGIEGMPRDTVLGFRDKQLMKERVAKSGVRVPQSHRARTRAEVMEAARAIGFPVVLKPIAGAGSADTHRCDDLAALESALGASGHVAEAIVEEFIDGRELTYDAISIDGVQVFESVTEYHPKPIIARNEQWISPAQITFRDPLVAELAGGIELGRAALRALGMGTGFTHLEWYSKPNGEAVFGEVAARSGGGNLVDMMNWANDIDAYREWARAVCWHRFEAAPQRRYFVAMVFKRAQGEGIVRRIAGLERVRAACRGAWVGDTLPAIGSPKKNWKQSVTGDGGVAIRHPDYDDCRALMDVAVRELKLYAG
jgi:biotin carboxylase